MALPFGRHPTYGKRLPHVEGAGGWPVEEPTHEELSAFIAILNKVPLEYFGPHDRESADYGTEYTCVGKTRQWLELLRDAQLLYRKRT